MLQLKYYNKINSTGMTLVMVCICSQHAKHHNCIRIIGFCAGTVIKMNVLLSSAKLFHKNDSILEFPSLTFFIKTAHMITGTITRACTSNRVGVQLLHLLPSAI